MGGGPPTLSANSRAPSPLRHLCGPLSDLNRRRMTHRSAWPEDDKDVMASEEFSQITGEGWSGPPYRLGQKSHVNKLRPPVNEKLNIQYLQHNFFENAVNLLRACDYYTLQRHPLCAEGTLPLSAERPKAVSVESIGVSTSPRTYYIHLSSTPTPFAIYLTRGFSVQKISRRTVCGSASLLLVPLVFGNFVNNDERCGCMRPAHLM